MIEHRVKVAGFPQANGVMSNRVMAEGYAKIVAKRPEAPHVQIIHGRSGQVVKEFNAPKKEN